MTGTAAVSNAPEVGVHEDDLRALCRKILRRDEIDREESFFAMGGRSIQVVQMLAQVSKTYDVELEYKRFFEEPTLAMLVRLLEEKLGP